MKKCSNPILVGGGEGGRVKITPQEKNGKNGKNRQAAGLPGLFTKQNLVFDVSWNFQVNLSFWCGDMTLLSRVTDVWIRKQKFSE